MYSIRSDRPLDIAWPPDREVVMNVAGFQDAFEAAVTVQFEADLSIRVVSLPGLAVLKLLAWSDRGTVDSRDARDLATLLRSYADAGNNDRLYEAEFDAMEAADFNLELAGARLLGRDARLVASENVRAQVLDLLRDSTRRTRLATAMATVWSSVENVDSAVEKFLEQFQGGLQGL
jgi:predicted nucleotidyltransferase